MSLLTEAHDLIHGQREKDYSPPRVNFARIAQVWSAYKGIEFTPEDVAAMMVGLKLCRLANDVNHRDTWIDIAGYCGCWERLSEEPCEDPNPSFSPHSS
jgi:hypothetical protein